MARKKTSVIKKHIVIDARIRPASTGRPVARLLEHLQEIDSEHRYTILLKKDDGWRPQSKNFAVKQISQPIFSFNPLRQISFAWQLYQLKPDLTYFTLTPSQPLLFFGKFITLTHDLVMFKFAKPGRLPRWLHWLRMKGYGLLMWHAHKFAAHVIVPTEFVADEVNKFHLFTNRKTTVIHEASEPPLPGKAKTPNNPPEEFIMYTGSAFPHKNLERLAKAFNKLREKHPDLKLVLIGKREHHSHQLEKLLEKQSLLDGVVFTGFISDEELKWYYQNARAYVFASLNEGFGLPGLEAMVHGCPVVSSNATCLPEVNGEAAHYFDPEDVNDMAKKIEEVISSEKRRSALIEKGFQNAKRFSWKKFTKKHLDLFKEFIS